MTTLAKQNSNALDLFTPEEEQVPVSGRLKNYLDRATLLGGQSRAVTDGKAMPRQFAVGKDAFLPQETPVLVLATRPHAVWLKDNAVFMESYDPTEEQYGTIASAEMDPSVKSDKTQSAMAGTDFLLWFPAIGTFGVYHLAKSSLEFLSEFAGALPQPKKRPTPGVLYSSPKETKSYKWYVPRFKADPSLNITNLPDAEQAKHAFDLFNAPRPQGRGEAPEGGAEQAAPTKGGRKKK